MSRLFSSNIISSTGKKALQNRAFIVLLCTLFVCYLLMLNQHSNLAAFRLINDNSSEIAPWLQWIITDLGNGATLGAIMLCCLIKRPELTPRVLCASILSLILLPLLKQYFDAPRPAAVLDILNIVGEVRTQHSFPSAHSSSAFLFAGTLILAGQFSRYLWLFILMASMAAVSRVLVGAHWPIDVVAGAMTGLSCAYFASHVPLIRLPKNVILIIFSVILVTLISCELSESIYKDIIWQVIVMRWSLIGLAAFLLVPELKRYFFIERKQRGVIPSL